MNIHITKENSGAVSGIFVNAKKLLSHDQFNYFIPDSYLRGKKISIDEIPYSICLHICYSILGGQEVYDSDSPLSYSIERIDERTVSIDFQMGYARNNWNESISIQEYFKKAKDVVVKRQNKYNDVWFDKTLDENDCIIIQFNAESEVDTLDEALEYADLISNEFKIDLNNECSSEFRSIEMMKDEAEFTEDLVIPLIKKLGFINVRYSHGVKEYGKDMVFARLTEFDDFEYWGAQIKFGNISGGVNSQINEIIGQAEDAFCMPFNDIYSRAEQTISKFLIIISGRYTENAVDKIIKGIRSAPLKNNLIFIDGEKVKGLIEKARKK